MDEEAGTWSCKAALPLRVTAVTPPAPYFTLNSLSRTSPLKTLARLTYDCFRVSQHSPVFECGPASSLSESMALPRSSKLDLLDFMQKSSHGLPAEGDHAAATTTATAAAATVAAAPSTATVAAAAATVAAAAAAICLIRLRPNPIFTALLIHSWRKWFTYRGRGAVLNQLAALHSWDKVETLSSASIHGVHSEMLLSRRDLEQGLHQPLLCHPEIQFRFTSLSARKTLFTHLVLSLDAVL